MRIHSQLSLFGSNSQQLRVRVEADRRRRIGESMVGSLREEESKGEKIKGVEKRRERGGKGGERDGGNMCQRGWV